MQILLGKNRTLAIVALISNPACGDLCALFTATCQHDTKGIQKRFTHPRQKLRGRGVQAERNDKIRNIFGHRHRPTTVPGSHCSNCFTKPSRRISSTSELSMNSSGLALFAAGFVEVRSKLLILSVPTRVTSGNLAAR